MAVLGLPYSIMYLSTGVSGLTNIVGYVRKPDGSTVGPFHFTEGAGAFLGCYFSEYYTSLADLEGRYYVRIFSPTEARNDATSFDLAKDGSGTTAVNQTQASDLVGYVTGDAIDALIEDSVDPLILVDQDIEYTILDPDESEIMALVNEIELKGSTSASEFELKLERDL